MTAEIIDLNTYRMLDDSEMSDTEVAIDGDAPIPCECGDYTMYMTHLKAICMSCFKVRGDF